LATRHSACAAKVSATNQLEALIVGAPRGAARPAAWPEDQAPGRALRQAAGSAGQAAGASHDRLGAALDRPRIQLLAAQAHGLRAELDRLVAAIAPWLLELPGVGPISAAQVLVSWSHAGRLRAEAAFAALAGANPVPASSGQVTRHRLNRGGDRQLNRVLHTIVVARLRDDPQTRTYAARRRIEGKRTRDIRRCLKRAVARQLFKLLERCDAADVEVLRAA
jgi:transposase